MEFIEKHKALIITILISGTVVLAMFGMHIKKQTELVAESYYEIEPEKEITEEELKILEALEQLNNSKAETNKAFNETVKEKSFAEAYKPIAPPEDYVKPVFDNNELPSETSSSSNNDISDLNREEISSFSKVNDIINSRTQKKEIPQSNNKKSTIRYSLVDRTAEYLPIPIYLCEAGGKIVINITVDSEGNVIDTYLNSSSTSVINA